MSFDNVNVKPFFLKRYSKNLFLEDIQNKYQSLQCKLNPSVLYIHLTFDFMTFKVILKSKKDNLRSSLGYPRVILGSSWNYLGHPMVIFCHPMIIFGHPMVIFGHHVVILGSSWGHLRSSWSHPGTNLGHSWGCKQLLISILRLS